MDHFLYAFAIYKQKSSIFFTEELDIGFVYWLCTLDIYPIIYTKLHWTGFDKLARSILHMWNVEKKLNESGFTIPVTMKWYDIFW